MSKVFLDTNILVYTADFSDRKKQEACRDLLDQVVGRAVLSTQVMQEFYVTATRKLGIDPVKAKGIMVSFDRFEIVTMTPHLIREAVDCQVISQISFWDALILVAAESARCEKVWTEDLHPGQVIRGVRVENPLKGS